MRDSAAMSGKGGYKTRMNSGAKDKRENPACTCTTSKMASGMRQSTMTTMMKGNYVTDKLSGGGSGGTF